MFNLSVQNSGPYDRKLIELDTIDRWALIVEATSEATSEAGFASPFKAGGTSAILAENRMDDQKLPFRAERGDQPFVGNCNNL